MFKGDDGPEAGYKVLSLVTKILLSGSLPHLLSLPGVQL